MLVPGHLASSYLLAESTRFFGHDPTRLDIFTVILFGNILDLDFFVGYVMGKKGESHHRFFSHTPIYAIFLWLLYVLLFNPVTILKILTLISISLHLVLDDLGYWLCKLGLQEESKRRQINWLWPFVSFSKLDALVKDMKASLDLYYKAKINVFLEVLLSIVAIIVFTFLWIF